MTLGGIARETSTIRLGTMVTSATFRHPGVLAISVAQVDEMSGGRVELGLGAGWFEAEHEAYAIPFPPLGERFDRLGEQLDILTGLWATPVGETFDYSGTHYSIKNSPALPKPAQTPYPPIIIGGGGPKRTPALTAKFAAEFNIPFVDVETPQGAVRARGRGGRRSGPRTGFADVLGGLRRVRWARTTPRSPAGRQPSAARSTSCAATHRWWVRPARSRRSWDAYSEAGVQRVYLQVLDHVRPRPRRVLRSRRHPAVGLTQGHDDQPRLLSEAVTGDRSDSDAEPPGTNARRRSSGPAPPPSR